MLAGINAAQTRDFNRLVVLQAIRQYAPTTRAEVSRRIKLSAPAVTYIVNELIAQDLILEVGRRGNRRGQPAIELTLNAEVAYTVGLLLDSERLAGVLVNLAGELIASAEHKVTSPDPTSALSHLADIYHELLVASSVTEDHLLGVGLVTMGPIDEPKGGVIYPPLLDWGEVPLRVALGERLGKNVVIDNNATAAAIGEYWYGVGSAYASYLYIHFSYGLGGGLFLEHKVRRGRTRNAAEFGHLTAEPGGLPCPCGRRGCLETRASLHALYRDLGLRNPHDITLAFERQDAALLAWLKRAGQLLAEAAMNVDHLLDLDAVIVDGDLQREVFAYLLDEMNAHAAHLSMRGRPSRASFHLGTSGSLSAALGAASLPSYNALAPAESNTPIRAKEANV